MERETNVWSSSFDGILINLSDGKAGNFEPPYNYAIADLAALYYAPPENTTGQAATAYCKDVGNSNSASSAMDFLINNMILPTAPPLPNGESAENYYAVPTIADGKWKVQWIPKSGSSNYEYAEGREA